MNPHPRNARRSGGFTDSMERIDFIGSRSGANRESRSGLRRGLNGRPGGLNGRAAETADGVSHAHRRVEDPPDRDPALIAMPSDGFEAGGRHAAAVAAIRISSELAWSDAMLE